MLTLSTYEKLVASRLAEGEEISSLPNSLMVIWLDDYYEVAPRADLVTVDLVESGSDFTYVFDLRSH